MDASCAETVATSVFGKESLAWQAFELASSAHAAQCDKAGMPYIWHPLSVALALAGSEPDACVAAALLHDVVEDAGVTVDALRRQFGDEVADAVALLTHEKGMPYLAYVQRIAGSGNEIALRVKLSDLTQNMNIARIPGCAAGDLARIQEKYLPAYEAIAEALAGLASDGRA
ncbi:MAG: HD domain-containing protein [Atopobiaceae bacterium]